MSVTIHLIRTDRPHFGRYSGIGQFVAHLDPRRYRADVYVASDSDADFPIRNRSVRTLLRRFVQRRGMAFYKLSDLVAEMHALKKCWQGGADVIHFIDGEHTSQFLPLLWRRNGRAATRLVATFHQPPARLAALTRKDVIARLDHVTAVSPEQLPYLQEIVGPERVSMILHGIDVEYFQPPASRPESGPFRCLTVGHWLRDFGVVREVARSFQARADVEFHVVVSHRTCPPIPELEGLANVTVHRSHIDDAALRALYQGSHVLLLPLRDATANNAVLESIACGLPVLSADLPSLRAYLPGQEALLVARNDPAAFVAAIERLRTQPEARAAMAQAARRRAEELAWHRIAPQYEALYAAVSGRPSRAGGHP